jgi:predicted  nucleic acid-binding Zn-ribbon protein
MKEDSNKTLFPTNSENNEGESSSIKQNKPETIIKELNLEEKSILSKYESFINNDINLKTIQESMDDLDKRINEISNSFKKKSNEWQSNHSEISDRLNCLMWQMNQFHKEQTELSQKLQVELNGVKESVSTENQKLNEEINGVKESVSTETQKLNEQINGIRESASNESQKLNEELNGIKESISTENQKLNEEISGIRESVSNEVQRTADLKSNIDELKLNKEKMDNDSRESQREVDESILQQKVELQNLDSKLKSLQAEFEEIKEKVTLLSTTPAEEPMPKKVDLSNIDDDVIAYITKCVQEKIEQQYKLRELEASVSKPENQELSNDLDVKLNKLNEKVDEFQIYQLSREVELQRMKIKLNEGMDQLNKACGRHIEKQKDEKDEVIRKLNMDNRKLNNAQNNLEATLFELSTTLGDLKKDVFSKLKEQQSQIEDIRQSSELLQKRNENIDTTAVANKEVEQTTVANKEVNEVAINSTLSEKFDKIQQNINSLNDEIQILNMETKVMTTNISLIWDDVRSVKNFINQYDMNDKLKKHETNEEISELYDQIANLKMKINENL